MFLHNFTGKTLTRETNNNKQRSNAYERIHRTIMSTKRQCEKAAPNESHRTMIVRATDCNRNDENWLAIDINWNKAANTRENRQRRQCWSHAPYAIQRTPSSLLRYPHLCNRLEQLIHGSWVLLAPVVFHELLSTRYTCTTAHAHSCALHTQHLSRLCRIGQRTVKRVATYDSM